MRGDPSWTILEQRAERRHTLFSPPSTYLSQLDRTPVELLSIMFWRGTGRVEVVEAMRRTLRDIRDLNKADTH